MKVHSWKLMVAMGVMLASSFIVNPTSQAADGKAPGEGYYAGAFLGFGTGILQAKVETFALTTGQATAGNYETDRGGLGLSGIQGGVWLGWGMKTADDLYFGAEISGLGSDEKIKLTTDNPISGDGRTVGEISEISATRKWTGGGALRVGYYVNSDTLFSVKGGIAVSQFDVDIGSSSESYYAGGPQFGGSMETRLSKIDPNLSLRMEFVYTDYLTADILGGTGIVKGAATGNASELTGHDSAGRIGLQYSF